MASKRAKFREGQIVFYKTRDNFVQITSEPDGDKNYYMSGDPVDGWAHESEFRPLTAREIGPRKGKSNA